MENNAETQPKKSVLRHYSRVMAFAVVGMVFALSVYSVFTATPVEAPHIQEETQSTSTAAFSRSAPVLLKIPKIGLETTFENPLGLNDDQTIEVPDSYTKVGWYKYGATPGEIGPSVILGHVDSYQGPAVFYKLGQLEVGDEVEVTRGDGTVAVFVVTSLERVSQNEFPTQKVYGATENATIRLITCTGLFNKGAQRYSHNLVVYGELKETGTAGVVTGE